MLRLNATRLAGACLSLMVASAWSLAYSQGKGKPPPPATQTPKAKAASKKKTSKRKGRRTLVDALDEKVPLEVGVQLRIFKQARKRKAEIDRREGQLDRQAARLKTIMRSVESRYKTLRMVQEELSALNEAEDNMPEESTAKENKRIEKEREAKVAKLSKVFNKMKADEAAKMIPVMEEDLVVDVISRLKPKQAANILGKIKPEQAARLTVKMTMAKGRKKKKSRR